MRSAELAYAFFVSVWVRVTVFLVIVPSVAALVAYGPGGAIGRLLPFILSGLVGTAAALMADIVIQLAEWIALGSLKTVPRKLREAATHQVFECGYYRKKASVHIRLWDCGGDELAVRFKSTTMIVTVRDDVQMHFPQAKLPDQGTSIDDVRYQHGGKELHRNGAVALDQAKTEETLVVLYRTKLKTELSEGGGELSDEHYWTSPVEGFDWTVTLPEGYMVEVSAQTGADSQVSLPAEHDFDKERKVGEYMFRARRVLFSYQAVTWRVWRVGGRQHEAAVKDRSGPSRPPATGREKGTTRVGVRRGRPPI